MKIKSINISSFGGVKNLKLEPNDGLNVIYGSNEMGKTTVMSFIKMMFYGSERGSAQISKNIRKKYTPWDGSPMAGSIDFEYGGRNYRLEREFRSSNSTDRVTLLDLDLGERQIANGDIGTNFFGLSAQAFERSLFIGQFGYPESDAKAEGEINSKLSNIALTGDETVSFETVKNRLLKAKTALMSKGGNAGIYDKNLKNISALNERLQKSVEIQKNYQENREKVRLAEAEILKMEKKAKALKEKISAEQDIRNTQKLKNLLELKNKLDTVNQKLTLNDGTLADEAYYKKLVLCRNLAEPARLAVESKEREIETLKKSITAYEGSSPEEKEKQKNELSENIKELEQSRNNIHTEIENKSNEEKDILFSLSDKGMFKKKFNPVLLIMSIVSLAVAILVLSLSSSVVALLTAFGGALLLILSFILKPEDTGAKEEMRKKSSVIREEISKLSLKEQSISETLATLKVKLETVSNALSYNANAIENQKTILENCQKELQAAKENFQNEWSKFAVLFSKYKPDVSPDEIETLMEEISSGAEEQKEIKRQINYILKDIGNISYEEVRKKLETAKQSSEDKIDFDAIKSEYEALDTKIVDGKTALSAKLASIKASVAAAENPEILRQTINSLTKEAENQKAFCSYAQIAMDVLEESFIEVRKSYGSELEKSAAEIMSSLTDGKYENMSISKSLQIATEERGKFGSREIDYLSSGTADQAYLSLRLSLAKLMSDKETLPLFLDDSLSQYDDIRLDKALSFLNDYLKEGQGLLFTCHGYLCESAKKAGASVINL